MLDRADQCRVLSTEPAMGYALLVIHICLGTVEGAWSAATRAHTGDDRAGGNEQAVALRLCADATTASVQPAQMRQCPAPQRALPPKTAS